MKKLLLILFVLPAIIFAGCTKDSTKEDASALAQVGTYWTAYDNSTVSVTQADGSDVQVTGTYGSYSMTVAGKMTTEGMSDYFYSNGDKSKPFTLVKYSDPVGTKYEYNIGNLKVVRTVIYKSTTDDFYVPGLGLMIKVSEIQEDVPEGLTVNGSPAQARTIYWYLNHKFGVVYAQVVTVNGDTYEIGLQSTNAGQ